MTPKEQGTGYCNTCKQRVPVKWEDWGIGQYEYWGEKGTHHDWIAVCPRCGDDLEDTEFDEDNPDPREWDPWNDKDVDDWREDR